ncbi:LysR family transcriptional regulator [Microbacterium sp. 18062]|uniref:LysR family transcriptional regulator n=1 Tax=Microbacterium sp. 18062 TaxID=2681410 RepID=UPI001359E532|nr:LysR substrate-binding domain-containing protein [Microbacterium sp. 18062]
MNVEIRHLRQFLAVAEELHFSRAADRLHLAQPALSANIRKLEESLQLRLFARSTRQVELTNEGQAFAEHARIAVESYDRALEAATHLRRGGTGPVTLGVYSAVSTEVKRAIVNRLREINPDIELTIVAESSSKLVEAVLERRIDAALCVAPTGAANLHRLLITNEAMVVALPEDHPLAGRSSVGLSELAEEAWILPSNRAFREGSALHRLSAQAGFTIRVAEEVSDFDEHFTGVAAGHGIEVVPESFAGRLREGVVILPIDNVVLPIYLIGRSDDSSPTLSTVFDAVVDATEDTLIQI